MEPDRWDRLAESLWNAADEAVDDDLVRAVAEAEVAQVSLVHRLRASAEVVVHAGDLSIAGTVEEVGLEAVVLGAHGWTWFVPIHSITAIEGLAPALAWDTRSVADRLGLASNLRSFAGQQAHVYLAGGRNLFGVLRSVGADHIDIAAESPGTLISVTTRAIRAIQMVR